MARNDPARAAAVLERAREEAMATGSSSIEAEHALLAIAAHKGTVAQQILAGEGLDHESILAALRREFEESLAGAGVALSSFDLTPARRRDDQSPRLGASLKLAIIRAPKEGSGHRLDATRLLAGILAARVGTVPRALSFAGVDQGRLASLAEHAIPLRRRP